MQRTLSEQRALKQLGITDFRHMTKNKVVRFASMLPYMDPDVAKRALEQFPAFKDLAGQLVGEYKTVVDKALAENSVSQNTFYKACDSILESLRVELQVEELSENERSRVEDRMIEVADMIGAKDSENKRFLLKVVTIIGFAVTGVLGTAAAILGSNSQSSGFGNLEIDE